MLKVPPCWPGLACWGGLPTGVAAFYTRDEPPSRSAPNGRPQSSPEAQPEVGGFQESACGFDAQAGKSQHEGLADDAQTGTGSEGHTGSEGLDEGQMTVVKNTPSMSPRFRGFDFKVIPRRRPSPYPDKPESSPNPTPTPNPISNPNPSPNPNHSPSPNPSLNPHPHPNPNPNQDSFHDVAPAAKVSAIADNLAAALGVACQQPHLRSALVIVLGTAPAVATLFRDPSGKGKFIETAIWQSWVRLTKR
jgi:hypothetical protein